MSLENADGEDFALDGATANLLPCLASFPNFTARMVPKTCVCVGRFFSLLYFPLNLHVSVKSGQKAYLYL